MAQEYAYKPLTEPDSIRLIELQPSSDPTAAIQCSLVRNTLSSEDLRDLFTHYNALSYVWGCSDMVETIWVDEAALKITASLSAALHDLRDEKNSFFLWADGICINQNDDIEKGVQVRLMGRIYEEATNTIIYMGPALAESLEFQCLRAVRLGHPPSDAQLLSILRKAWFTRVWVFQELVFASNPWIQCGKARARWITVCKKVLGVSEALLDEQQRERHRIITQMYEAWIEHQSTKQAKKSGDKSKPLLEIGPTRNTMLELVKARRGLGVSDPRDMIFAHIGFAQDAEHDKLKVDYSKTNEEVYIDFALFVAEQIGWQALLENVGIPRVETHLKDLPSWVPDWSVPVSTHLFPIQVASTVTGVSSHPRKIYASTFDTIKSVSLELRLEQFPLELYQDFGSRASRLDIELERKCIHGPRRDLKRLHEQWSEAYQIWKTAVGGWILHPQFYSHPAGAALCGHKTCDIHAECETMEYSVELYLTLAFRINLKIEFLKGKSSQEGDVIVPVNFSGYDMFSYECFVFHPLGPLRHEKFNNNTTEMSYQEVPEMECEFVGGCFRHGLSESSSTDQANNEFYLLPS